MATIISPEVSLIEPVDDPRTYIAAYPLNIGAEGEQPVHDGLVRVPRPWVHRNSRGFVQNDDITVLVDKIQRERLRDQRHGSGWGNNQRHQITHLDLLRWPGRTPVEPHVTIGNEPLQLCPSHA